MSILTLYYVIPVLAGLTVAFIVTALYYTVQTRKRQWHDKSILSHALFGREKEIRSLADRIRTGQSSAIIGFFSEERRNHFGIFTQ
jgi:hypothetical protein